jgi:8-oxo-dGTP diphosphatase
MVKYTVGFLFDSFGETVALIRKARPEWQAGRWNGIGGKFKNKTLAIDPLSTLTGLETPEECMNREFEEETGVSDIDWEHFATTIGPSREDADNWEVYYFKAFDTKKLLQVETKTDEEVSVFPVDDLPKRIVRHNAWLLVMAQNSNGKVYKIYE